MSSRNEGRDSCPRIGLLNTVVDPRVSVDLKREGSFEAAVFCYADRFDEDVLSDDL